MRFAAGLRLARSISDRRSFGSIAPATLEATWSCNSKMSSSAPSKEVGPDVRAGCCVDQLPGDPHPIAGFAHTAFEHVAHAELLRHLLHVDQLALVGEGGVAGDDKSHGSRAIAVVISSTMPSTKYSCSASPVMFWNGNTASDGLSGSGSGAATGSVARDDAPRATP